MADNIFDDNEFRFHLGSTLVSVALSAENVGGWSFLINQIKEVDSGIDVTNLYDHEAVIREVFNNRSWEPC